MITEKINIKNIISTHFKTFKDERTGNKDFFDYLLFIIIPLLVSIPLAYLFYDIQGFTNVLITSLSIFTGLLFNLLLLTYDLIKRNEKEGKERKDKDRKSSEDDYLKIKGRLLNQIFNNISYSILISIFALFALILSLLWSNYYYLMIISFFVYSLTINFFLTLLMVLKRTHNLLSSEF